MIRGLLIAVLLAAITGGLVYAFLPLHTHTGRIVYLIVASPDEKDSAHYRALQANSFVRREVLNAALQESGTAGLPMFHRDEKTDPVKYLQENLKVDSVNASQMVVKLEGDNPEELLTIMKAIDTAYMRVVYERDDLARKANLMNVQSKLTKHSKRVNELKNQPVKSEDEQAELTQLEIAVTKLNTDMAMIRLSMDSPRRVVRWEAPSVKPGIDGTVRRDTAAITAASVFGLGLLTLVLRLTALRPRTREETAV